MATDFLTHPFVIGLALGLLITIYFVISGWNKRRILRKEVKELREHLHIQMTINAKGNQAQVDEATSLKTQNENLRSSLAALKAKPEKAELLTLHLYDKAIHLMSERAPGFSPAWESSLRDAQTELDKIDTGVLAWVRKVVRPSLLTGGTKTESDDTVNLIEESKQ